MIKKAAGKNDMSKRILVVDDQPDIRQIIRDMLAPTDYERRPKTVSWRWRQSQSSGPISS
jgi:PleD family two-component response regulator